MHRSMCRHSRIIPGINSSSNASAEIMQEKSFDGTWYLPLQVALSQVVLGMPAAESI